MLTGKTVQLREFEDSDWVAVHSYASQEIVSRYQPWGPNSEKDSIHYVKEAMNEAKKAPRNRYAFAVIEPYAGKLVGAGELHIKSAANREGEVGYVIDPDYWGKGYATDTAKLLLQFGFETLQLHRIFATCDSRNKASEKVLQKIGMTLEGRLRANVLLRDGWRDSLIFSILEREWKKISVNLK